MNFITSYCRIKNGAVNVDGKLVFSERSDVQTFATALYDHIKVDYPKFYKMDNLSKLGFLAAELILEKHELSNPYSAAVILSNSAASLDTDIQYQQASAKAPSPAMFVYTLANIVAGEICIRHKIKGESNFFVSPEYDPDFLSSYIRARLAESITMCVAGWVEVLGETADVFLYVITNRQEGLALEHTSQNLKDLYRLKHG